MISSPTKTIIETSRKFWINGQFSIHNYVYCIWPEILARRLHGVCSDEFEECLTIHRHTMCYHRSKFYTKM